MPSQADKFIGARIAELRAKRGLTQTGLAMRAHISKSLLSKVECGQRPASHEMVAACARALGVTPADLLGQPYREELRADELDLLVQPIREALNLYNVGGDPAVRPRPLAELADERDRLCALIHHTELKEAAVDLPALLAEATTVAHTADRPRAWALLCGLNRVAFNLASKLGYQDLALLAASRTEWAADRAQDPILAAMGKWMSANVCSRYGEFRTGLRLQEIGRRLARDAEPGIERDAAIGQKHLSSAVLAARLRDTDAAAGHLEEAERHVARTGEATPEQWLRGQGPESSDPVGFRIRGVHWYAFGPTNVKAHKIAALADQNRHAEAVRVSQSLRIPTTWPVMRAGQVHIDVARSHLWTGQEDAAFMSLLKAQNVAPQQTRYHPQVREVVTQLRRRERSRSGSLAHFAQWVGVA
ncbi:helix-turn-helix domain-containing protein [Streptomyces sp. 4N509B]|uniref:helix-turn-helix domain-containing protein n=1 Tax=Streptomyces sp. 4N509B TaxID=3457413 RepID=UPI003FD0A5D0